MKNKPFAVWKLLIGVFAVFWVLFAVVLFSADIPFLAISMALSTLLVMSAVVIGLAWAYQNNI